MYRRSNLDYYEQAAAALYGDVKCLSTNFPPMPTPSHVCGRLQSNEAEALVEMLSKRWTEATLPRTFREVLDILFAAAAVDLRPSIMKRWIQTNPCPSIVSYLIRNNPPINAYVISGAFLGACDLRERDIALALMPSAQPYRLIDGFYAVCCGDMECTDWVFAKTLLDRMATSTLPNGVVLDPKTSKYWIDSSVLQTILVKALSSQNALSWQKALISQKAQDEILRFVHKYLEVPQSEWCKVVDSFLRSWYERNPAAIRYAIEQGANWCIPGRIWQRRETRLGYPSHKKVIVALYEHGISLKLLRERVPGIQRFQRFIAHQRSCFRKRLKCARTHSHVFTISLLIHIICEYAV